MATRFIHCDEEIYEDIENDCAEAIKELSSGIDFETVLVDSFAKSLDMGDKLYFKRSKKIQGFIARGSVMFLPQGDEALFVLWESAVPYNKPLEIEKLLTHPVFNGASFKGGKSGREFKDKYVKYLDLLWEYHALQFGSCTKFYTLLSQ